MAAVAHADALTCCASERFAALLSTATTDGTVESVIDAARRIWWNEVGVEGWLQAFAAHPRIGDVAGLKAKFGAFASHSQSEQAAGLESDDTVYQELADWNRRYEEKFGHIFIVCASGKTAEQMLAILQGRYTNSPYAELSIAAAEQMKITEIRLNKILAAGQAPSPAGRRTGQLLAHLTAAPGPALTSRSPITTHVLDAALGTPARDLHIVLHRLAPGSATAWEALSGGRTNDDGRVPDLLPSGSLTPGRYKMWFDTGAYLRRLHAAQPAVFAAEPFYPEAAIEFVVTADTVGQHFHIPLLLSPYSYSTYRGS